MITQLVEIDHTNLLATGNTEGYVCIWDEISWVKILSVQSQSSTISSLSVRRVISTVQKSATDVDASQDHRQKAATDGDMSGAFVWSRS